jgi:phosphoglycerate dehydrogenase-like enzyme
MHRLRGLFILDTAARDLIYGPQEREDICRLVDMPDPPQTRASIVDSPELLRNMDVMFSGWGAPVLDDEFLARAPRLKAVFYGSGSVATVMTHSAWARGIIVTTASAANAIPVAEYTLGTILFSLKHGWLMSRKTRQSRNFAQRDGIPGAYGSTIGLVSVGMIARILINMLKTFDLHVLVYDPFLSEADARSLGVERVSLEDLFLRSDVVSIHTPHLPETEGMITGLHIAAMKPGATFINTARGQVIREREMIEVLKDRQDLQAVLDVTSPEPPEADSPLYTLANVVLTPHIAGSIGPECRRLGRYMVEELRRFISGEPLQWAITPELAERTAHRPRAKSNKAGLPVPRPLPMSP